MKKALVIGATGIMGAPMVKELLTKGYKVYAIARKKPQEVPLGVVFYQGNALDKKFMKRILEIEDGLYDVIIDYMWYNAQQFSERIGILLNSTKQYFCFSSAGVYDNSDSSISEDYKLIADLYSNAELEKTSEYRLEKAKIEEILKTQGKRNWVIVRPHITFNNGRMPLFFYESLGWVERVYDGQEILVPNEVVNCKTNLTHGDDVAREIGLLLGKANSLGETYNLASSENITWGGVIKTYQSIFAKHGINMNVKYIPSNVFIKKFPERYFQMQYDRLVNRTIDVSKILLFGKIDFKSSDVALGEVLENYISNHANDMKYSLAEVKLMAFQDKYSMTKTKISKFAGKKAKILFCLYSISLRLGDFVVTVRNSLFKIKNRIIG